MYALVVHGGAGTRSSSEQRLGREARRRAGLASALSAGEQILKAGGSALDAVEAAVAMLEDDSTFNAGRGAVLTLAGTAELDAAIMDGTTLRAGAVAQLRHTRNPIRLARLVLEQCPHVFLVGDGADAYATAHGLTPVAGDYFITPDRQQQLAALQGGRAQNGTASAPDLRPQPQRVPAAPTDQSLPDSPVGTVGAVARDRDGRLAAATSTGGTAGQLVGRVGDSPVIGAGTYAEDEICAISTTGDGEAFLRTVLAYDIAARVRYRGDSLALAVEQAIHERLTPIDGRGGVIAINARGQIVVRHNATTMAYGHVGSNVELSITA